MTVTSSSSVTEEGTASSMNTSVPMNTRRPTWTPRRRWSDARAAGGSGAYRAATCSQRLPTAPTTRTPWVSGPTGMFPHSFSSTPQGYALQASYLLDPEEGEVLGEVDRSRLRKLVAKTGRPVQSVVLLQDRPALEGLRALEAAQGGDDRTPHLG